MITEETKFPKLNMREVGRFGYLSIFSHYGLWLSPFGRLTART